MIYLKNNTDTQMISIPRTSPLAYDDVIRENNEETE